MRSSRSSYEGLRSLLQWPSKPPTWAFRTSYRGLQSLSQGPLDFRASRPSNEVLQRLLRGLTEAPNRGLQSLPHWPPTTVFRASHKSPQSLWRRQLKPPRRASRAFYDGESLSRGLFTRTFRAFHKDFQSLSQRILSLVRLPAEPPPRALRATYDDLRAFHKGLHSFLRGPPEPS